MALRWPKIPEKAFKGGSPILAGLLTFSSLVAFASPPEFNSEPSTPLAPGYQALPYKAPNPGTYSLSDLGPAADAQLIDSTGSKVGLHALMRDKVTLMSFIYASCGEVNGCPWPLLSCIEHSQHSGQILKLSPSFAFSPSVLTQRMTRPRSWLDMRNPSSRKSRIGIF